MLTLFNLQEYLDGYLNFDKKLDVSKIDPYMTNGLMVKGKEEVKKIGYGVSASLSLFEKAREAKCDCIIVHHSFNLPIFNRYDSVFQNRIGFLMKNNISLFGYHFLLDAHPEIGNNVQIIKTIGAKTTEPYLHQGNPWGWVGEFDQKKEIDKIINDFTPHLSERVTVYSYGTKKVKRVVAISGMGSPLPSVMHDLIEQRIDLYITGEAHEWNRELFKEAKVNFIAGGHYHTERFGIKALMAKAKMHFPNIDAEWIELENEI